MREKLREKRNKFADRLLKIRKVRKAYEDSWYVHARMFGDIMEPAFTDDMASRLELVAALNYMSRNEISRGINKLSRLMGACKTDDDFAAWYFFMGVCYERARMPDRASIMYAESAKREPQFYMVYLLLAKCLHECKHYETAVAGYIHALELVMERPRKDEVPVVRDEPLMGSIHGNMANCLVMMRRYDEAEYELYEAEGLGYTPPYMNLTWAMLFAATDRKQQARERMAVLREKMPEVESKSVLTIEEILAQKNPRFALRKLEVSKLEEFWAWFVTKEADMRAMLRGRFGINPFTEMNDRLQEIFGFNGEQVVFNISRDGHKVCLSFFDNYNLTLEIWLEKLVDLAPKQLREKWSFYAVH